jgi:hypothetical protein
VFNWDAKGNDMRGNLSADGDDLDAKVVVFPLAG